MLIMLRGLPGSGKTTAVREMQKDMPDLRSISRDDIRAMLTGSQVKVRGLGSEIERAISTTTTILAKHAIAAGDHVIIDSCNLSDGDENHWRKIANQEGTEFVMIDKTDVPLEVCIERNQYREFPVPVEEIHRMHNRYFGGKK